MSTKIKVTIAYRINNPHYPRIAPVSQRTYSRIFDEDTDMKEEVKRAITDAKELHAAEMKWQEALAFEILDAKVEVIQRVG